MNNFQKVAQNTVLLWISEVFLKIAGAFWIIFLVHSLSIPEYGRYNFVNAFIGIFSFLPDLGVGLIVIREIAKQKEKADIYLGNSLILNGVLSLITFFIILLTASLFKYPTSVEELIVISALTLFFSTIRSVAIFYFDGVEKMGYSAFFNSLNTVLLLSFATVSLFFGHGLKGVFVGMLMGTIISTFITWGFTLNKFIIPRIKFDTKIIWHLLKEGFPLGLAAFASLVYMEIDSVILGRMLGERSVGIYGGATPFVFAFIQLLNVPFVVALYPALVRVHKEDKTRFVKALKKSLFFIFSWSFPLAISVSILSPFIIPLVFGTRYLESIPILQGLIFLVPFASLSALLYKTIIIVNKQYYYVAISIFGAVINVMLNILLIPHFNIQGAVYASLLTQVLVLIMYSLSLKNFLL